MEIFSLPWFGALASIIAIDLILAGDNALVIAIAARSLPKQMQKKAVFWGTFGAIAVRIVAASFAILLLKINGFAAACGALLFWIAYELVKYKEPKEEQEIHVSSFWEAMRVIVVADALMGLDNVIAIAGAARGDTLLVAIGLVISIPIVMGGSVLILKFIHDHPWIIWMGGALLGYTGGSMIVQDNLFNDVIAPWLTWLIKLLPTFILFFLGWLFHRNGKKKAFGQAQGT